MSPETHEEAELNRRLGMTSEALEDAAETYTRGPWDASSLGPVTHDSQPRAEPGVTS